MSKFWRIKKKKKIVEFTLEKQKIARFSQFLCQKITKFRQGKKTLVGVGGRVGGRECFG
jgi:hypothetical protein